MKKTIQLKAPVELGFLPTHAKFLDCLVPGEDGLLPRRSGGEFAVVVAVKETMDLSPVAVSAVQIPVFPGTKSEEWDGMISELQALGLNVHLVMMMGGVDPMDPADEDASLAQLLPALEAAKRNGVTHVSATSVEQWMQQGAERKNGPDLEAAVEQNVKLHVRAYEEAGLADSCIEHWDIEFLRPGEFQTFTDLGRLWIFVNRVNERLGRAFFRCLVDAAHCGDSELSIAENQKLIEEIAAEGGLGVMHASAKTTRGCLSTDDGWIAALLGTAVKTGELKQVFVEMFHHEDPILEGLRAMDPGHGVDTMDGRQYPEAVADGLATVARCLNNYVSRGFFPKA